MILPAAAAKLAANGRATIALIPVKEPHLLTRKGKRGHGTTYWSQPWTPVVGRHEPLRASHNGKAVTIANVVIGQHSTMLLAALLDPITEMLALTRAAGHKTKAELAAAWMRAYDTRDWPPMVEELCPRCEGTALLRDGAECPDCDCGAILVEDTPNDETVLARFKARHGLTLVHVIGFYLDKEEHVRLLSPTSRPRGDDLGYTPNPANAMEDAGEAVPAAFQAKISRAATERAHALRDLRVKQAISSGDTGPLEVAAEREIRRLARSAGRAAKFRDAA